jgi:hypothetical protein
MDRETLSIISSQTGINDLVYIEKIFYECDGDIGTTVCKLQNIPCENKKKRSNNFDEMRMILNEKDMIYDNHMKKIKK